MRYDYKIDNGVLVDIAEAAEGESQREESHIYVLPEGITAMAGHPDGYIFDFEGLLLPASVTEFDVVCPRCGNRITVYRSYLLPRARRVLRAGGRERGGLLQRVAELLYRRGWHAAYQRAVDAGAPVDRDPDLFCALLRSPSVTGMLARLHQLERLTDFYAMVGEAKDAHFLYRLLPDDREPQ